jgi:type IV secretion system protein VirD4
MYNNYNNGQKGTARFAEKSDCGSFGETVDYGKHIYAGKSTFDQEQLDLIIEASKNVMIFGGTGSAKTTAILEPNIILRHTPFFMVDPKGSSYFRLAPFLIATGYEVYGIAPFIPGISSSCNPLAMIDPKDPEYADSIELITAAMILVSIENPHWGNSARRVIAGVIAYVIETPGEKASLGRVMEILCGGLVAIIAIAKNVIEDSTTYKPNSLARRKLARYATLNNDNREAQSILSTALAELNFLDSAAVCECLSGNDIRFEDLTDPNRKIAIFLILPPEKLDSCNKLTRLIISMVINTISRIGGDPDNPVDLYIDEAGTIGPLPILSQGVALMREKGMRFWTVYQSLSQLQRDYPADWKNFIGNSNPLILLDVMDSVEAAYFSNMLGETTLERRNGQEYSQYIGDLPYMLQNRYNGYCGGNNFGDPLSGTSPRPLMTPDELRRLPENLGIVITDGHPAFFHKAKSYEAEPFCHAVQQGRIR